MSYTEEQIEALYLVLTTMNLRVYRWSGRSLSGNGGWWSVIGTGDDEEHKFPYTKEGFRAAVDLLEPPVALTAPPKESPHEIAPGVIDVLKKVDYALLADQKQTLLRLVDPEADIHPSDVSDTAQGLITFLDNLQDAIVEEGIADEKTVFPYSEDNNEEDS